MKFNEKYHDKANICSEDKRGILVLKDKKEKREYRGNNPSRLLLTAYRVRWGLFSCLSSIAECDSNVDAAGCGMPAIYTYASCAFKTESVRCLGFQGKEVNSIVETKI